ncbi:MAG: carbon-nitrogen hydrolase family protein, partial [Paenibacillus sp.]|nr:carbon-nitrogen hydrolase family protein [Paenibacillus sp.]
GTLYNTAVLFGRGGELVGKYRKTHLTTGEFDMGITPGKDLPVFELDFGKVGLLICWDAWFTETARILALQGADIICVPLNGDGVPNHAEHVWPTRAFDNGVYMVYSSVYKGSPSAIIAPNGEFLASVAGEPGHQTVEIDLEERKSLCPNLSVGLAIGEGKVLYFAERRPDLYPNYFA